MGLESNTGWVRVRVLIVIRRARESMTLCLGMSWMIWVEYSVGMRPPPRSVELIIWLTMEAMCFSFR